MSLNVEVKKLSQDVSIADGQAVTQNFVLFELPNGGMVKAAIDETAAEALLDAFVKGADSDKILRQDTGYEPPAHRPRRMASPPDDAPDSTPDGFTEREAPNGGKELVFGGENNEPESAPPAMVKPTGRVAVVGRTEMGYPVLRAQGNVADPGEISNGVGVVGSDEDGVASV